SVLQLIRTICRHTSQSHDRDPHSFPTRRSSDLTAGGPADCCDCAFCQHQWCGERQRPGSGHEPVRTYFRKCLGHDGKLPVWRRRSEEHTSELQSRENLVCRLLLEKKNMKRIKVD